LHENRTVRTQAGFFGTDLRVVVLAHVEIFRVEQLQVGETPHLIGNAAENALVVHGGVGGDDAVDLGKNDEAVGSEQCACKCGIGAAGGANDFAGVIDFDEAAALARAVGIHFVMRVLETGEHMPVGQAEEGMRVRVAIHVREGGDGLGMERVAEVEDESPSSVMIIGKEHAAGGHGVFSVVDEFRLLIGGERSHKLTIG
jgi:hypothetical protein